jgi:hypothetical protein
MWGPTYPTYPVTNCNILEDQNPWSYKYENDKSQIQNLICSVSTVTMNEVKEVRRTSFTWSWERSWLPKCSTSLKIRKWTKPKDRRLIQWTSFVCIIKDVVVDDLVNLDFCVFCIMQYTLMNFQIFTHQRRLLCYFLKLILIWWKTSSSNSWECSKYGRLV